MTRYVTALALQCGSLWLMGRYYTRRTTGDAPWRTDSREPNHGREASQGAKRFDSAHRLSVPNLLRRYWWANR